MMRRRRRGPVPTVDASGECRHLYLNKDATCVHCGMKFALAWQADQGSLLRPTVKNIVLAVVSGVFLTTALTTLGQGIISSVFLVGMVLFFTRAALGGLEIFVRHIFIPGKLGPLIRRAPYNILAAKRYIAFIGSVKLPVDLATYEHFEPGDTLLIEHLRWSRLPVAIYKGSLS